MSCRNVEFRGCIDGYDIMDTQRCQVDEMQLVLRSSQSKEDLDLGLEEHAS